MSCPNLWAGISFLTVTCMRLLLHANIDLGRHWRIYDSDGLTNHGGKAEIGLCS